MGVKGSCLGQVVFILAITIFLVRANSAAVRYIGDIRGRDGTLYVGNDEDGTLLVNQGTTFFSRNSSVGGGNGGSGFATITGTGSLWETGGLAIGLGHLEILDGGTVRATFLVTIGSREAVAGHVTVDGPLSLFDVGDGFPIIPGLTIGSYGDGTLHVTNGGRVEAQDTLAGYRPDTHGVITVEGPNSVVDTTYLTLGRQGLGDLFVRGGGLVKSQYLTLGSALTGAGRVEVAGSESRLEISRIILGEAGNSEVAVLDGAYVKSEWLTMDYGGRLTLNDARWDSLERVQLGTSSDRQHVSRIDMDGNAQMFVGDFAPDDLTLRIRRPLIMVSGGGEVMPRLELRNGSVVAGPSTVILGYESGQRGRLLVTGPGSSLISAGPSSNLYVGDVGEGYLEILRGGAVHSGRAAIGSLGGSGHALIAGPSAQWTATHLTVGSALEVASPSSLTIRDEGSVQLSGILSVRGSGTVQIEGGSLLADSMHLSPTAGFDFDFGRFGITSDIVLDSAWSQRMLGQAQPRLDARRHLELGGEVVLRTPITIEGGSFLFGDLLNRELVTFQSGIYGTTGDLQITSDGPLGATLNIAAAQRIEVRGVSTMSSDAFVQVDEGEFSSSLTVNHGTLAGSGLVEGTLRNVDGELRVNSADRLRLTGPVTNLGRIEARSGEAEFDSLLVNESAGRIVGRDGVFRFDGGLANSGRLELAVGQSEVFGRVENLEGGEIVVARPATATFYDDIANGGDFSALGSTVALLGDLAGNGISGDGSVYVAGTLRPGAGVGRMRHTAELMLGSTSRIEIELAGDTPGTTHDLLESAESLVLAGSLEVKLVDGYLPEPGTEFEIIRAPDISGEFDAVELTSQGGIEFSGRVVYEDSRALFIAEEAILAGDYNGNGLVEQGDLDLVLAGWGTDASEVPARWTNDLPQGAIDQGELDRVLGGWGASLVGTASLTHAGTTATVPEPASLVVLFAALTGLFVCRASRWPLT
jgi:T5SS/PEP-CTERM-associated repeat protein